MGDRGEGRLYRPKYIDRHGVEQESAVWWFAIGIGGRKVRVSTGFRDERDAKAWRLQRLAELGRGNRLALTADRLDLAGLMKIITDEYVANDRKSIRHLVLQTKRLTERLGNPKAVEITTDRLRRLATEMKAEEYANATINLLFATLQRAFTLAAQARRLSVGAAPHFPYLEVRNARKGFFEAAELEAILAHVAQEHRAVFRVAYITGWRLRSELLTRQWRHVDLDAGWLRLDPEETKNRDGRNFPLVAPLRAALEAQRARTDVGELLQGRVIPWVFWHGRGKPWATLQHLWERAREAAGFPGKLMHDFRRTAVRNLERAGVPRSAAMAMVGHKTETMYRRYAIADEGLLRESGAKLAALLDLAPEPPKVTPLKKSENSA